MKTDNKTPRLSGLRSCLRRYSSNGYSASSGRWSVATGGYDLNWELCYDGESVIRCMAPDNAIEAEDGRYSLSAVREIIRQEYGIG